VIASDIPICRTGDWGAAHPPVMPNLRSGENAKHFKVPALLCTFLGMHPGHTASHKETFIQPLFTGKEPAVTLKSSGERTASWKSSGRTLGNPCQGVYSSAFQRSLINQYRRAKNVSHNPWFLVSGTGAMRSTLVPNTRSWPSELAWGRF